MGKNILILSASPRKGGNSDILCDRFMSGAEDAGHDVEKIYLKDQEINYCTGCGSCNSKKACSQHDDMAGVLEKMVRADVIVMATPVYFYNMNGQMKTLIDRTCARYAELRDKEFYFIAVAADAADNALDGTIRSFRNFTSCLKNPVEKGIIRGTGAWLPGDIERTEAVKYAYEAGRNA